jgi:hypothetical protein
MTFRLLYTVAVFQELNISSVPGKIASNTFVWIIVRMKTFWSYKQKFKITLSKQERQYTYKVTVSRVTIVAVEK